MSRLITECVADIPSEAIQWLWPGRIPLGAVSLLAGQPGAGKSILALEMAAIVSRGGPWPDQIGSSREPGATLIVQAEDHAETTLARLTLARAELLRIRVCESGGSSLEPILLDLQTEIDRRREQGGDVKLVIIDPISSHLQGADQSPAALALLPGFAARNGVAVLLTAHLNPGDDKLIHRIAGAPALASMPRMIWSVARDPVSRSRRVLSLVKRSLPSEPAGNLSYDHRGDSQDWGESRVTSHGSACANCGRRVAYLHFDHQLIAVEAEASVSGARIQLERHHCRDTATPPVATRRPKRSEPGKPPARRGPKPLALMMAVDWCYEKLREGPISQAVLIKLARGRGIARTTLSKAMDRLAVSRARDEEGRLIISLAADATPPPFESSPVAAAAQDARRRFDRRKEVILAALANTFPSGLTLTEIRRMVPGKPVPIAELRTLMTVLRNLGQVRSHAAECGGRYRSVWTLTDQPSGH